MHQYQVEFPPIDAPEFAAVAAPTFAAPEAPEETDQD